MAINISGVGTQPTLSTNKNDRVQKKKLAVQLKLMV